MLNGRVLPSGGVASGKVCPAACANKPDKPAQQACLVTCSRCVPSLLLLGFIQVKTVCKPSLARLVRPDYLPDDDRLGQSSSLSFSSSSSSSISSTTSSASWTTLQLRMRSSSVWKPDSLAGHGSGTDQEQIRNRSGTCGEQIRNTLGTCEEQIRNR